MITTEIGSTTPDRITVRGRDLSAELIGKIDFVDMIMLTSFGRTCSAAEKDVLNAILVTVCDHGLTPSALAARLTWTGAPEAPQAAVAAGLLGAGNVFLGAMSDAARMLVEALDGLGDDPDDDGCATRAAEVVARRRAERLPLYGYGHNIHRDGDPRVSALYEVARRNGLDDRHWRMARALERATADAGRPLPMNAAVAIAALVLSVGLPPDLARGLALIGRCAGLVAHLVEEEQHPTGRQLWRLVLEQDPRNVLP